MTSQIETISTIDALRSDCASADSSTPGMTHRVDFQRDVVCLMGLPFDVTSVDGVVAHLRQAAHEGKRCFVSTPNLNFVMTARSDAAFRDSVLHSDLSLADGMPLVWIARLLGLQLRERVSGADLFEHLASHVGAPIGVYFFGGQPGAARAAAEKIGQREQGVRSVGFDPAGFGSLDDISTDDHVARINRSDAQFVVVALGAQKGQAWIERNRGRLTAPLICHLGAVVNFVAGSAKRAPTRVQALGLEWLWRIKEEPELWRRYWRDGRQFLVLLATQVLPYATLVRWHALTTRDSDDASISMVRETRGVTLKLRGAWTRQQLQPLRDALARLAASEARELCIDLKEVQWIDSAFIGLMLLARGAFVRAEHFVLRHASSRVTAILRLSGAGYLLASSPCIDHDPSSI